MEKDWEARFENRPARGTLNRTAATAACGYLALTIAVFIALQVTGWDMIGPGAIPVAVLTAPWSVLVIMAHPSFHPDPARPTYDPLVSSLGTFVLFPIVCGGLNAIILYWAIRVVQRRRQIKRQP